MHSPTACDNLIADRSQVLDSKRRDVRVVVLLRGLAASAGHLAVARDEVTRERRPMKEHAWKSTPAARADAHQIPPTQFRINHFALQRCESECLRKCHSVCPWFEGVSDTVLTQCRVRLSAGRMGGFTPQFAYPALIERTRVTPFGYDLASHPRRLKGPAEGVFVRAAWN
jgi:hypothetical protein